MLKQFITPIQLIEIIKNARLEDTGENCRDITSEMCVPDKQISRAAMVGRQDGILCGAAILKTIAQIYDERIEVQVNLQDGAKVTAGQKIAVFTGPRRSILTMERVALNFVTHLSGIATLTGKYVEQVKKTKAQICDTRKTIPGLRALEKYAVHCGGGTSHRIGLYDAVLIKDNHLTHIDGDKLFDELSKVIKKAKEYNPAPKFIQVEVDTLAQLEQVLKLDIDIALLDNMSIDSLKRAVDMRDKSAPDIKLEASGGINLNTVQQIAQSGVDRISVGALTHSAPAVDIGLDV